jgi:hypothetical protein
VALASESRGATLALLPDTNLDDQPNPCAQRLDQLGCVAASSCGTRLVGPALARPAATRSAGAGRT